jgi:iron complex transport system permease protein
MLVLIAISGIILFFLDIMLGSVNIPVKEVFSTLFSGDRGSQWYFTLVEFRVPKAIVAVLAGAALSLSGLQMQTIFRNPLAGPFILGISAGAGLGVAILVMGVSSIFGLSLMALTGQWAMAVAAWLGAALILLVVLVVSIRVKDIMTILIFGIMFGSAASAIVSILQYFSTDTLVKAFVVWTMGSLGSVTNNQMLVFVAGVSAGLLIAVFLPKYLNALLLGEHYARSMGVNIFRIRVLVFISTSLLAGTVTAFCGPIGFIGIAIPHVCRMLFKTANHQWLIPASIILGANVMLISDIVSQLPGYQSVLPINSITALIGIPVVVYIIIRNRKLSSLM